MATIAMVSNAAWNLANFRRPVIEALVARGDRVIAVAPSVEDARDATGWAALEALGCTVRSFRIDAKGTDPARDSRLFLDLWRLYARERPDIALHFTIKPVIYGSIAASMRRLPTLNTVTGLGTVYVQESWVTRVVERLYRVALRGGQPVVFQNSDDLALFRERGLLRDNPVLLVPGSGVDLAHFAAAPMPPAAGPTIFLMVARLLRDKGVTEFVAAARALRAAGAAAAFRLLGPADVENRTAIDRATIDAWVQEGVVRYLGTAADVRPHMASAHCIVLPSYREGLSRVLIEAGALGRPAITTDMPGCRDVVRNGVNGYLCRPRDSDSLADAMRRFLALDEAARASMGHAARAIAEREFDARIVVARYLEAIDGLLAARQRTM